MSFKFGGSYLVAATEQATRDNSQRQPQHTVHFLDNSKETFEIDRKSKGQCLLELVFNYMELTENDYFGLQFRDGSSNKQTSGLLRWLDPSKPLKKQLKYDPPYVFWLGIRFYLADPVQLQEEYTRYQYCLQIKRSLLDGSLHCSNLSAILLASYAIQADLGDYSPDDNKPGYLNSFQFIPNPPQDFIKEITAMHVKLKGLTPAAAELQFLQTARVLEFYGVHLHDAIDHNKEAIKIGVSAAGISVFSNLIRTSQYQWSNIVKLSFKNKQFFVHLNKTQSGPNSSCISFILDSRTSAKRVWKVCIENHIFFRLPQAPSNSSVGRTASGILIGGRTLKGVLHQSKRRQGIVDRTFNRTASCRLARRSLAGPPTGTLVRSPLGVSKAGSNGECVGPTGDNTTSSPGGKVVVKRASIKAKSSPRNASSGLISTTMIEDDSVASATITPRSGLRIRPANTQSVSRLTGDPKVETGRRESVSSQGSVPRRCLSEREVRRVGLRTSPAKDKAQVNPPSEKTVESNSFPKRPSKMVHSLSADLLTDVSGSASPSAVSPRLPPKSGPPARRHTSLKTSSTSALITSAERTMQDSVMSDKGPAPIHLNGDSQSPCSTPPMAKRLNSVITVRIVADSRGRFGFNVKGGIDKQEPVRVLKIGQGMPAQHSSPPLNIGDRILSINGTDVDHLTQDQIVQLIRSCSESSKDLLLVVKPSLPSNEEDSIPPPRSNHVAMRRPPPDQSRLHDTKLGKTIVVRHRDDVTENDDAEADYGQDYEQSSPPLYPLPSPPRVPSTGSTMDEMTDSILALEETLQSGLALTQFEQLYRFKPGLSMNDARDPDNIRKNRYRDITPYDETRVHLERCRYGDYINASYVNMSIGDDGTENRYIAAQGPLPSTCEAFWQMCYEQNVNLVVMLTANVEKGKTKCHQYWPDMYETLEMGPDDDDDGFGQLQLSCLREDTPSPSFVHRQLLLTHQPSGDQRSIYHMQYTTWPDHGVPPDPLDFVKFVAEVNRRRQESVDGKGNSLSPVVVHCSAGIGRTGVLITMETAICLMERGKCVLPLEIVQEMRDQRAMLIQTSSQYYFVCLAIVLIFKDKNR